MLRPPVAPRLESISKENHRWSCREIHTTVIVIVTGGLSSGPPALLTPWQESAECSSLSQSKNHLLPSISYFTSSFLLFYPSSCLTSVPRPLHFSLWRCLFSFSPHLLSAFWCTPPVCIFPLYSPSPRPPLALSSMPSGSRINKWLLKGYHWFEKPGVTSPPLFIPLGFMEA